MKYAIIKKGIVIQVQPTDNYKLSKDESIVEVKDDNVVCGQVYDGKKFTNPVIVKTDAEIAEETKKENEATLIANLGADSEVNALAKAVNIALANIAKLDPQGEGADLLKMVQTTLNK